MKNSSIMDYVTYKSLWSILISAIVVCGGILSFIYSQHISSTHPNSVNKELFSQFQTHLNETLSQQNQAIERINVKLDKLMERR